MYPLIKFTHTCMTKPLIDFNASFASLRVYPSRFLSGRWLPEARRYTFTALSSILNRQTAKGST